MQEKSDKHLEFSDRTERLASRIGVKISELPDIIRVSASMFYAYRTGKQPISDKTWRKLEQAERASEAETGATDATNVLINKNIPPAGCRMIPVVGWAHAGQAEAYEELPKSWQEHVPTECQDAKAFAVRLEGDSMEPKFSEDDMLICQPSEEIHSGCYVVARFVDDGVVFRRLELSMGVIRLVPLNERYPVTQHQASDFSWIYPVWGRWTQIWKR